MHAVARPRVPIDMTTTPNEPVADPDVVPSGDPVAPGTQPDPDTSPEPIEDPDPTQPDIVPSS
jgi:hypothetical protein